LKERKKGGEDEEEFVGSYCMTLRKSKGTGNRKKEALDSILWRTNFRRGYGLEARRTT
jgi:hypothetical protein